jgi:hypothetical protein
VLADVPVPQRQRQALAAHQAGAADSDRRRRLLTSHARLGADREPLIGVKTAISAPGMPDHPGPQNLIGERAGHRWRHLLVQDHRR